MDLVKNDPGSTTDAGCIQKSDLGIEFKLAAKRYPIESSQVSTDSNSQRFQFVSQARSATPSQQVLADCQCGQEISTANAHMQPNAQMKYPKRLVSPSCINLLHATSRHGLRNSKQYKRRASRTNNKLREIIGAA
jgi:hypothetical protein